MKVNDKVKYIGVRQKEIVGCVGFIVALKNDNEDYEEYNLRSDEALVDFGSEDECLKVVRFPQLEIVEKEKHMSKELEAFKRIWAMFDFKDMQRERSLVIKALNELEELKKEVIARQETENSLTEWVAELTNELEALKKTPTADEVCKALSEYLGYEVEAWNEYEKMCFKSVYTSPFQKISKNYTTIIWLYGNAVTFEDELRLPPYLITMIGRFYESLEEMK